MIRISADLESFWSDAEDIFVTKEHNFILFSLLRGQSSFIYFFLIICQFGRQIGKLFTFKNNVLINNIYINSMRQKHQEKKPQSIEVE